MHFLFCTFFCFNQCTDLPFYITSVRAFQTLSDAFRKSKPTASSRSLLPICLETPSKSSSRLGKRLGSSPKNSDFSMCQVLLLGQMLGLGDYRALDPIKKPLPSSGSHRSAGGGPSGPLVDAGSLLTLQRGSPGASLGRKMCWEGLPKTFHVEPRGKKGTELLSHGFVLLGGLFPEGLCRVSTAHGQARAAAVVRKGLLFGLKPFEVVIRFFFFSLMVFFLSTGPDLVLFSFLFLDLFETTSYLKGALAFNVLARAATQLLQIPAGLS